MNSAERAVQDTVLDSAVRSERGRLLNFIRGRVRTEEDAEDILQDVFFQLIDNYDIAEPIERISSWLYSVARNRIVDWYRKKRPAAFSDAVVAPGAEGDDANPLSLEEILFDPTQHPDETYARSLVWPALSDALDELPDAQREVFALHELEGKSFKEIAEMTGTPVNTLLSRKRYAVIFLREKLRELYDDLQTL